MSKPKKIGPTVIDIYPEVKTPKWLKVGSFVDVLGEGSTPHVVLDLQPGRAAVEPVSLKWEIGKYGACWESVTKLSKYKGNVETRESTRDAVASILQDNFTTICTKESMWSICEQILDTVLK